MSNRTFLHLRNPWPCPLSLALLLTAGCMANLGDGGPGDVSEDADAPDGRGGAAGRPVMAGGGGTAGTGGRAGAGGATTTTAPAPPLAAGSVGPMPLRRLTRTEYVNTIKDLLGLDSPPAVNYPADEEGASGFRSADRLEAAFVRAFQETAEGLAIAATTRMATLHPCDAAKLGEPECAQRFVTGFGQRAYRRPLLPEEVTRLRGLYDGGRDRLKLDHAGALGLVVEALLQSPSFLYHWELGPTAARRGPDGNVPLTAWELASRLSYFLTASMPDAELFAAAEAGRLGGREELERQARRLLATPRVRERYLSFHTQWLEMDEVAEAQKNPVAYPLFRASLAANMAEESNRFITHVLTEGDGKLKTLLTARFSFVNERLAEVYKMDVKGKEELRRVDLPAGQRAGLLTQAAFLTAHGATNGSNPPKRGKVVVERLLCRHIPPPVGEIPPVEEPSLNKTTRERFEDHLKAEMCKGCHALIDPPGFAFEHYDGIGGYRAEEAGKPVNAAGSMDTPDGPRSFKNAVELLDILAASEETRACYVEQWFRFGLRREVGAEDAASLKEAARRFAASDHDVRELLVALTTTPSFLSRAAAQGEETR